MCLGDPHPKDVTGRIKDCIVICGSFGGLFLLRLLYTVGPGIFFGGVEGFTEESSMVAEIVVCWPGQPSFGSGEVSHVFRPETGVISGAAET